MDKLDIETVHKIMGEVCIVDRKGYWLRIGTHFTYPDGNFVDVYIHETYLITTVTDFGESVRTASNRHQHYRDPQRSDMLKDAAKLLGVDFNGDYVTRPINNIEELKDAVLRVGLMSVVVGSVY